MKRSEVIRGTRERENTRFGVISVLFLASAVIWWSVSAGHLRVEKRVSSGGNVTFKPFWASTPQKPKAAAEKTDDTIKSDSTHERLVVHEFGGYAERSAGTPFVADKNCLTLSSALFALRFENAETAMRSENKEVAAKSAVFFNVSSARAPPAI